MPPFAARFMLAIFLPVVSWVWAFSSPNLFFIVVLVGIASYFYPTIEAVVRQAPNTAAIVMLNLFLGWTLVGWVVALVWAVTAKDKSQERASTIVARPKPYAVTSGTTNYQPTLPDKPQAVAKTRACPFCAEEILKAAVICKHCKSTVSAETI